MNYWIAFKGGEYISGTDEFGYPLHTKNESESGKLSAPVITDVYDTYFKFEYVKATIQFFEGKGILVTEVMPCTTNFKLAIDMDYDGFKNLYYGLLGIAKKPDEML